MNREDRAKLKAALDLLDRIPARFQDSTVTYSPDSIMRNGLGWMCRIYDWRLCSRCHAQDAMPIDKKIHYVELKEHIGLKTPWYRYWSRLLYWKLRRVVKPKAEKAYDACGYSAGHLCRHNMPIPLWMERIPR